MLRRLVYRWGARAKHAVLMRVSSHMPPQRAAYFSDGPTRHHRSGPTPRPRWAVCALLKTRNRLIRQLLELGKLLECWGDTMLLHTSLLFHMPRSPVEDRELSMDCLHNHQSAKKAIQFDRFRSRTSPETTAVCGLHLHKCLGHSKLETTQLYAESSTAMMRESLQRALSR